eukprot:TRINITY_DN105218_c0_g1_i1.p1 TRINITY_DN105218_c0_g1~~TRINITY_DN105218_c0_g1_i1.p1  ORF type:complete len:289 (-),score=41.94 TRINITY_DN105218_c0_g1_i1:91-957(-)
MKRKKAILSFDDDDLAGDDFAGSTKPKVTRSETHDSPDQATPAPALDDSPQLKVSAETSDKKSKEYAWMDSEDESDRDGSNAGDAEDKASLHPLDDELLEDVRVDEKIQDIGSIETFPEFVRLTPALTRAVPSMSAEQLTALCETAVRIRHFDRDLFTEVYRSLCVKIRTAELDIGQVTVVATALVDLNAYDAGVFKAAAAFLMQQINALSKEQRLHWLKLLASSGHQGDDALVAMLRSSPLPGADIPQAQRLVCYEWMGSGFCPRGNRCTFAHSKDRGGQSFRPGSR